jgi:hypothetical protein
MDQIGRIADHRLVLSERKLRPAPDKARDIQNRIEK